MALTITAQASALKEMLRFLKPYVGTTAPSPGLRFVRIEADPVAGRVVGYTSNMDAWAVAAAPAHATEEGALLVPLDLLEYVTRFPGAADVVLTPVGADVALQSGRTKARLRAMAVHEFCDMDLFARTANAATVKGSDFIRAVEATAYCAKKDRGNTMFHGVHVALAGGMLEMLATDTYRFGMWAGDVEADGAFEQLVPRDAVLGMAGVARCASESPLVLANPSPARVSAMVLEGTPGERAVIARTLEGEFPVPAMKTLFAVESTHVMSLDRGGLTLACERADILASEMEGSIMDFAVVAGNELAISTGFADKGDSGEVVPVAVERGEGWNGSYNGRFLIEALQGCKTESVTLRTDKQTKGNLIIELGENALAGLAPMNRNAKGEAV